MWFAAAGACIAIVAVYFTFWAKRRYRPTQVEIVKLIENRRDFGFSKEWDYFRLVTIPDQQLDDVRERCLEIDQLPRDEQEERFTRLLAELPRQ